MLSEREQIGEGEDGEAGRAAHRVGDESMAVRENHSIMV